MRSPTQRKILQAFITLSLFFLTDAHAQTSGISCAQSIQTTSESLICEHPLLAHQYSHLLDMQQTVLQKSGIEEAQIAAWTAQRMRCESVACMDAFFTQWEQRLSALSADPGAPEPLPFAETSDPGQTATSEQGSEPPAHATVNPISPVAPPTIATQNKKISAQPVTATHAPGSAAVNNNQKEPHEETTPQGKIGAGCVLVGVAFLLMGLNIKRDRRYKSGYRGGSVALVKFGVLSLVVGVIIILVPLIYLVGLIVLPFVLMGLVKTYNSDKARIREEAGRQARADEAAERLRRSEAEANARQGMPKQKARPRSTQPSPEKARPTHHEVLGIRPTASKEEIDLAYRGRRTQYHPDKYPNADEETLKWATAHMQAVNEAYAALSDQNRR